MLSISSAIKGAAAAGQYYLGPAKEDYYLNGIDQPGQWFGGAAQPLRLGRSVEAAAFHHLLRGFSPDGQRALVQNAGDSDRDCGWDMTFSAPKAVSVLWGLSAPEVRRQIERVHQQAVRAALLQAEPVAGITRRGPGGKIKEPARLLWALFQEGTSRAQEPQVHTHAVLVNLGLRRDGSYGSISTLNLYRWKMALGGLYQAELASGLRQSLHVTTEAEKTGFRIKEVPKELCAEFSGRGRTIKRLMQERGLEGPIAAKLMAVETRPRKQEVPLAQLFPRWQERARAHGWDPARSALPAVARSLPPVDVQVLKKQVNQAVRQLPTERQYRSPIIREATRVALAQGADARTLFESLRELRRPDGQSVLWALGREQWRTQTKGTHQSQVQAGHHQTASDNAVADGKAVLPSQRGVTAAKTGRKTNVRGSAQTHVRSDHDRGVTMRSLPITTQSEATRGGTDRASQPQTVKVSPEKHHRSETQGTKRTDPTRIHEATKRQTGKSARPSRPHSEQQRTSSAQPRPESARTQSRTPSRIRRIIQSRWKALYDKRPWIPERRKFLHLHWTQPFRRALWGRLREVKLPSIGVELPHLGLGAAKPFQPRWWSIRWKKNLLIGELRIQDRILFPKAPQWSPFHGLSIPALRLTLEKSKWKPMKPKPRTRTADKGAQSKDHGHSH